jgi:anti-sigma-K factor RskA
MNHNELERKLIATARANPPSDAVPYAFEKRVMARLGTAPALDRWADWSRALWRAAAPCVAVAVVLGAWTVFTPDKAQASTNLSQELEATIFVAVTHDSTSTR